MADALLRYQPSIKSKIYDGVRYAPPNRFGLRGVSNGAPGSNLPSMNSDPNFNSQTDSAGRTSRASIDAAAESRDEQSTQ